MQSSSPYELMVTFTAIIFIYDVIITAADDGYLYIWNSYKIINRQIAHPKVPVMSLHYLKSKNLLISGSLDGRIKLWMTL